MVTAQLINPTIVVSEKNVISNYEMENRTKFSFFFFLPVTNVKILLLLKRIESPHESPRIKL